MREWSVRSGPGPDPETEGSVSGNKGDGEETVHHLGAIYPAWDGSEIQHWMRYRRSKASRKRC